MPHKVLINGWLVPSKGLQDILKAWEQFLLSSSHGGTRLLVCRDGPMENELHAQVEQMGLSKSIIIYGWQSNLQNFFGECDALILPSYCEGLPLVILDAMAQAKPVIATRVNGIPEAVIDRETGFLVNPGDIKGLAMAMINLAKDRTRAIQMGLRGRERCLEKFTLETSVNKVLKLYAAIIPAWDSIINN